METVSVQEQLEQEQGLLYPPQAQAFLELVEMGKTDGISCWRADAVERHDGSAIEGQGLFALEDIPANTLIAIKQGHVLTGREVLDNAEVLRGSQQQIGPNEFLAGMTEEEVDKNLVGYNHSCDPNAKILLRKGASLAFLVTRQLVEAGKELSVDYSTSQMTNTHFMICDCGAPNCRGIVAPLWDWEESEFQARHSAELAWFIQDEVDRQQQLSPESLEDQRQFHRLLKLAGGLRLLDHAVKGLEAARERQLSQVMEKWQPAMAEDWQQTPEAARLGRYDELRLKTATQFGVLYPLLGVEDLGIDSGGFLPNTAIDHGEAMRTMHERVGPHLDEITGLAEDLAEKFGHEFER